MSGSEGNEVPDLLRAIARAGSLSDAVKAIPGLSSQRARTLLLWTASVLDEVDISAVEEPPASRSSERQKTPEDRESTKPRATKRGPTAEVASEEPATEKGAFSQPLRLFTDGAARGNPGPAGAGAIIRDAGDRELERLGRYLGRATNNVAEYEAIALALQRAAELGARRVELFSDSELLVRQITGRYKVKAAHLKPLYEKVRSLIPRFESVEIRHVRRGDNAEADEMANRAIDERMV